MGEVIEYQSISPDQSTGAILTDLVRLLEPLKDAQRQKLLRTLTTFFDIQEDVGMPLRASRVSDAAIEKPTFSEDRTITPKAFLLQKMPQTDVERVVCLAYYLAHYRSVPEFKTLNISKLNTEAAQVKFANPAVSVENASKKHFIAATAKGMRQITSLGEAYVQALPDRERAKEEAERLLPHRMRRKTRKTAISANGSLDSTEA